ncbi:MAG: hypothetical protein DDT31_01601 [Syntrophomonadaceae bacterium]|nr:hypothetical protein [Bacillota bacterium]
MNAYESLYTSQAAEITFRDIEFFCSLKIPENSRLEYKSYTNPNTSKEDYRNIIKTIAAMANTDGGLIIVGVPEEKESGGARSIPGDPVGIPKDKQLKQTITNLCRSNLQPAFCPEILELDTSENSKESVFLIRVQMDKIPHLPIYHLSDNKVYVRFDEQNRPASREQLQLLFINSVNSEHKAQELFGVWLKHMIPNQHDFCWCTFVVAVPSMRFVKPLRWTSSQIDQLRKPIEEYRINSTKPWIEKWCPLSSPISDPRERVNKRLCSTSTGRVVTSRRGEGTVLFGPDTALDPLRGEFYSLWFDANGYMLGFVGFPWDQGISAKEVYDVFYALIELFTSDPVKKCYPGHLWDHGDFMTFATITQFPGKVTVCPDADEPESYPPRMSAWSGIHETEVLEALVPKELAKELTGRFLGWAGLLHYEECLETLLKK